MNFRKIAFFLLLGLHQWNGLNAQCWNLVWEDEFSGSSLNLANWEYQTGGNGWGNNELQYYTNGDNVTVSGGTLKITAEEDTGNTYPANDYTSSRIRTKGLGDWRYGKMEASIKLPQGQGIWPAFWMMPTDDTYGTWPSSGEIDIMEYLGHETTKTYGTCHYGNSPGDRGSQGSSTTLGSGTFPDAFHTFSIEWEPDEIRWYLDGAQFHATNSSHSDFQTYTWPFDQQFHFILNVAVGGNWPGVPDGSTVFPQTMEVDWVRVYQNLSDTEITGSDILEPQSNGETYSLPSITGATYAWTVPTGASIVGGQGTNEITVNWGNTGGNIAAMVNSPCGNQAFDLAVEVTPNQWLNFGFEDEFSHWSRNEFNGTDANFQIITSNVYEGSQAACVTPLSLGANVWDIQLGRSNISLTSGEDYALSFWAKANQLGRDIDLAFINASTYAWYAGTTFNLTTSWENYTFVFTAPETATAIFNLDIGDETGEFCFDDFTFARAIFLPVAYAKLWLTIQQNKEVAIHWITEQEENLDYFEVQHSIDAVNWQALIKIPAQQRAYHYSTLDAAPVSGNNYYRIKSVEQDGHTDFTGMLIAKINHPTIEIFPNPAREILSVKGEQMERIELYDLEGRLLKSIPVSAYENEVKVGLSDLKPGGYILKTVSKGSFDVKEFIKAD
jgi:beta-glucanase (GH16 family)